MNGRLIKLVQPTTDEDCRTIAEWLGPSAPSSSLSGDSSEFVRTEDVAEALRRGYPRYFLIVTHKGKTVGVVNWRPVGQPQAHGYSIGGVVGDPQLWNHGYGGEALLVLIDYLFHTQNAHRVQFVTALYNKIMTQILTKDFGPMLEGIRREFYYMDGQYHDAALWGILREEYYEAVAEAPEDIPQSMIPERDKSAARALLAEYLAKGFDTSVSQVAKRYSEMSNQRSNSSEGMSDQGGSL